MNSGYILIVDDVPKNLQLLGNLLRREGFPVAVAQSGQQALDMVKRRKPHLIMLDIIMPEMDGFEVAQILKENQDSSSIPIIFLTAKSETETVIRAFDVGAVDYITKPFNNVEILSRTKTHYELKKYQDRLEDVIRERTDEVLATQDITIASLASLAETRDNETGGHIMRTKEYVRVLASALQNHPRFLFFLTDTAINLIHKSAPLHDIGKVGIKDSILLKPGKLTDDEFESMKKHTILGRDAIANAERQAKIQNTFLLYAKQIACSHHEKFDGTGYPEGLKGDEIPIPARIMAIADIYDALISARVYKPAFSHKKSMGIILELKGTHLDPDITDSFAENHLKFMEIAIENADNQQHKVIIQSE